MDICLAVVFLFFLLALLRVEVAGFLLFFLVYPALLFFLESVGIIKYHPMLLPLSIVFLTGAFI